jgi:acyl carrier protein
MGLDSVMLVVNLEEYFNIQIPDKKAERVSTVQDAVDCIAELLNIWDKRSVLKDDVFERLQTILLGKGYAKEPFTLADLVLNCVPEAEHNNWKSISNELGLEIYFPQEPKKSGFRNFISEKLFRSFKFNYEEITFSDLVDAICGTNHKKVIDNRNIHTTYEIYIGVMGVFVDDFGIDVYEVKPHKRFTNDFGID